MALVIIENGIAKGSQEDAILSLIALEIAGETSLSHLLGRMVKSSYFPVQAKTLSLLKNQNTAKADNLIESFLTSNFIMLRLEALSILVQKRQSKALGQVEALMNMVHKNYHPVFVDFFAMARTKYALSTLKQMMCDRDLNLSLAAILAAKNHHIEELIPNLRSCLTNTSAILQEGAAFSLGHFKDNLSKDRLQKLSSSKADEVSLAASFALYQLGEKEAGKNIIALAKQGNPFAISLLPKIEGTKTLLHEIYYSEDNAKRIPAALALLELKDPLCLPVINDLITLNTDAYCLEASYSPGRCFSSLHLVATSSLDKRVVESVKGVTSQIQSHLLTRCIDLPRHRAMQAIDRIFQSRYNLMIPVAIGVLENYGDEDAKIYLKEKACLPGAPFIRTSCHLSLWRSTHEKVHQEAIFSWLKEFGKNQMIAFSQKNSNKKEGNFSLPGFDLTLEEKSHLLVQAFLSVAMLRETAGLDCIINAMIEGHEKNQIPLAGVLLKTIQ